MKKEILIIFLLIVFILSLGCININNLKTQEIKPQIQPVIQNYLGLNYFKANSITDYNMGIKFYIAKPEELVTDINSVNFESIPLSVDSMKRLEFNDWDKDSLSLIFIFKFQVDKPYENLNIKCSVYRKCLFGCNTNKNILNFECKGKECEDSTPSMVTDNINTTKNFIQIYYYLMCYYSNIYFYRYLIVGDKDKLKLYLKDPYFNDRIKYILLSAKSNNNNILSDENILYHPNGIGPLKFQFYLTEDKKIESEGFNGWIFWDGSEEKLLYIRSAIALTYDNFYNVFITNIGNNPIIKQDSIKAYSIVIGKMNGQSLTWDWSGSNGNINHVISFSSNCESLFGDNNCIDSEGLKVYLDKINKYSSTFVPLELFKFKFNPENPTIVFFIGNYNYTAIFPIALVTIRKS